MSSHLYTRLSAGRTWPRSWSARAFIFLALLLLGWTAQYVVAQATNIAVTTAFTPADPARGQRMDVAGVWNGTSEVTNTTGDTFTINIANRLPGIMYAVRPSVTLPAGFSLVPGSVTGATATVTGQTVTFTLSPANIPANGQRTITYGLRANSSVGSGTYALGINTLYKTTTNGADFSDSTSQAILVARGDSVISKTPSNQLSPVNGTVNWTVTVTNTGLGGLFDVVIDESAVGGGLQITGITQTSPSTPTASGTTVRTLPYLAPGQKFTLAVQGTVTACSNISNTVQTNDRTGSTASSVTAAVTLDLETPKISYTVPAVNMVYGEAVPVTIPIQNTGPGAAQNFKLRSTLNEKSVTVGNVSAGWSYSTATGDFTRTANGGTLAANSTASLSFTLSQPSACTVSQGGAIVWEAAFTDFCGDAYATPPQISSIAATSSVPTITLTKTPQDSRIAIGTSLRTAFTIQLNAQNAQNLATNAAGNVVVTDALSSRLLAGLAVTPSAGTSYTLTGNVVTWTVPRTLLQTTPTQTLRLEFDVPTDACDGGELLTNATSATATTKTGCVLNASANASILLVNNINAAATQSYNVATAPNGSFETGTNSTNGIRDLGEGEFIPITSSYGFSNGYVGKFAGSTYVDNFGGLSGQTLVTGSLQVAVDGGAAQNVPAAAILQSAGQLRLDLTFLAGAGFANSANVGGHSFVFTYRTTVPDGALPLPGITRAVTQVATLTLQDAAAGGGSCQSTTFRQGDLYSVSRAAANISVSMPDEIDTCQIFPVTITVNNVTSQQARNALITLLTNGNYAYVAGQTPVYGGALAGNILYNENSGNNPTFQVTSSTLSGSGTITVQMRRKVGVGTANSPVQARVNYDDNQTAPAAARVFQATGSDSPALVKDSQLVLTVTPQMMTVVATQAEWVIYVTNTGNGTAYDSALTDATPSGIAIDLAATNAANPTYPATMSGSTLTWNLGDIPTGATRTIRVKANVDGTTCTPDNTQSVAQAEWGCAGDYRKTATKTSPAFNLPSGKLQVLHDTSQSFFALCEQGTIVIVLRNTGAAHVYDAEMREVLTAGLTLVPGSIEYSLNGGTYVAGPNPTGIGSTGNPYLWTKTQIPALADLAPQGGAEVSEVRVRFKITSAEALSNQPSLPQIQASASGRVACGNAVTSPGIPFPLPARRPNITLVKDGRNITANPTAAFTDTVFGGVSDVIEWRVRITNNGQILARNVRLKDVFAGSGATTATVSGPGGFSGTITNNIPLTINDIPAGATQTYTITETLGTTCVDADNTASVTWGCVNNGPNAESNISSPSVNTDTARLNTIPDFSANGVTQTILTSSPTVDNGRVRGRVTIANQAGTAQNISFDLTVPANLELDTTVPPSIFSTTSGGATILNTVTVTGSHPTYTLTFNNNGRLRSGQNVAVQYYLLQRTNFDLTANGGVPLSASPDPTTFQSPETTANGLDPALPANGNIAIALNAESTCGIAVTGSRSTSVNPLTPDLDVTVSPLTQTVQTGESYTFDFYFTITNNGDAGSVANRINFRLPFLGNTWQSTNIFGPNGETGSTAITLNQPIPAGQSAVVRVRGVTQPVPTTFDLRMIGEVEGNLFGHDGTTDTTNNYSLDRAAPIITSDVNLSGYVYLDANTNAQRDAGENGTGLTLWAKLVPTAGGPAIKVVPVDPTTGYYQFIETADGSYSIVIDDNNTLTDVTPAVLPGWLGTEYSGLERTGVIIGTTNAINQNFGLFNGGFLQGRVFKDTGTGGGIANDGILNGGETGIPSVVVRLTDVTGGTVYATTTTDTAGNYMLNVPTTIPTGTVLRVVETNPSGYTSSGAEVNNSGGTYDRASDAITFTFTKATSYTGLNFGDVPPSKFTIDGSKTVEPGGVVYFPHVFTAATAGIVTFSTTHSATPNQPGWLQTIYRDLNGNGIADPGEPVITGPINVTTGESVAIIIQEFAPATVTVGAKDIIQVTANFELDTATPTIVQTLTRTDIATVSFQDELQLEKVVDLATANRGQELTYTVTYRNTSNQAISNLAVHDTTPAFTTFVSAAFATTPAGLTTGPIVNPAVGASGPINWNFTGSLAPGAQGSVTFKVKVNE